MILPSWHLANMCLDNSYPREINRTCVCQQYRIKWLQQIYLFRFGLRSYFVKKKKNNRKTNKQQILLTWLHWRWYCQNDGHLNLHLFISDLWDFFFNTVIHYWNSNGNKLYISTLRMFDLFLDIDNDKHSRSSRSKINL